MTEKVSVIIPAFNCEHTISRCVKSVLFQTYRNIEVIVVNDSSNDRTQSILKKIQKKDARLRVLLHESNRGAAASRNTGLDAARGDYIAFCDADDYMKSNMIEKMAAVMCAENADIAATGVEDAGKIKTDDREYDTFDDMVRYVLQTGGFVWNKLIRRSVIEDGKIRFDEDLYLCEDYVFLLRCMAHTRKMISISDRLYHYSAGGMTAGASDSHFRSGKFGYEVSYGRAADLCGFPYQPVFLHKCYMNAVAEKDSDYMSHALSRQNQEILRNVIKRGRKGFLTDKYIPLRQRMAYTLRDRLPFLKGMIKAIRR